MGYLAAWTAPSLLRSLWMVPLCRLESY